MRPVKFLAFLAATLVIAGCSKNDDIENTVSEQMAAIETVTEQEETAEMVSSAVLEETTEIEPSTALEETTKTAAVPTEPENSSAALQNTPLPISAGAYCLMDADTGEVLLSDQADEQLAPASITKVVTALVVAERHLTSTNQYLNGAVSLDGVYAGKSGWTPDAGATLVTAVQRGSQNLLVVVLGSERGKNYADTNYILDYYAGTSSPNSVCSASVTGMDSDGFTVSATASDSICQSKIAYWTNENGQDDIVWMDVPVKDGVISAHVSCAPGLYTVSILGYDQELNVLAQDDFTVLMCGYQMKPGLNDWNGARWAILENGACQIGWYEDGQWACYGDESGLMQEGFLDLGATKYYLKDYQVQRGWLTVDGKTYYGLASGELVTGQVVIDGEMRCFDEDGTLVE